MRSFALALPFFPMVWLLAALSTRPDTLFGGLPYCLGAGAATCGLVPLSVWLANRRTPSPPRVWRRYILFVLATLAFAVFLSTTFWPLRVRVLLSEPFMRPTVATLANGPPAHQFAPQHLGLFRFEGYRVTEHVVHLSLDSCGFWSDCGLAFSTSGPPSPASGLVIDHLYGPWWHLTWGPD